MQAAYLPQKIQADIFAKKLGPLATLATSPMFLQNPQFQAALGNLIMENLPLAGKEFSQAGGNKIPTYADRLKKEASETGERAEALSKAGKAKTAISSGAGQVQSQLGDFGTHIISAFNKLFGTNITPELGKTQNAFEDDLKRYKATAIQSQYVTPKDAEEIFVQKKNETPAQAFERIQRKVPTLFNQQEQGAETAPMDTEDQNHMDNELLAQAQDFSEQIREKYGLDVPEMLIFNYMQNTPGDVDLLQLLKAAGKSDKELKKAGIL
jgi:hypothetical protein